MIHLLNSKAANNTELNENSEGYSPDLESSNSGRVRTPYRVHVDESGGTHYYVGESGNGNQTSWTEVDYDPRPEGEIGELDENGDRVGLSGRDAGSGIGFGGHEASESGASEDPEHFFCGMLFASSSLTDTKASNVMAMAGLVKAVSSLPCNVKLDLAEPLGEAGAPTIILTRNGVNVATMSGEDARDLDDFRSEIQRYLSDAEAYKNSLSNQKRDQQEFSEWLRQEMNNLRRDWEANRKASAQSSQRNTVPASGSSPTSSSTESGRASSSPSTPSDQASQTQRVWPSTTRMSDLEGGIAMLDVDGHPFLRFDTDEGLKEYHDTDKNGRVDFAAKYNDDGSARFESDTDGDGRPDLVSEVSPSGKEQYSYPEDNPAVSPVENPHASTDISSAVTPKDYGHVSHFYDKAIPGAIAWVEGSDARGTPVDLNGDGTFGPNDAIIQETENGWNYVPIDDNSMSASGEIGIDGQSGFRSDHGISGGVVHSEPMPAIPAGIDPEEYLTRYTDLRDEEYAADRLYISDEEAGHYLESQFMNAGLDVLTGHALGAFVTSVTGGAIASAASLGEVLHAGSSLYDAGDAFLASMNGDADRARLVDFYEDEGKCYLGPDASTWSEQQVHHAAEDRADKFIKYVDARKRQYEAFQDLMQLFGE
ncbi:MAG TPA: hypothetical protein PK186_03275 [candidate division Zixibacteria bacterium]|nr:hypothetical protein [candidate division Zixibacteria bacterium]